jgi:hypothetical protein
MPHYKARTITGPYYEDILLTAPVSKSIRYYEVELIEEYGDTVRALYVTVKFEICIFCRLRFRSAILLFMQAGDKAAVRQLLPHPNAYVGYHRT